ncbi:hypothetical protein X777_08554 [Ooceraea biroi]|uniref:DUF1907 domain-containing protein n=1 Tax=Ooceraea biroi TaxID=2015173 RepID=A0A026W9R7_OOCBI|nr:hypothetical protein X777_08554 [Ooceraea biroi]
MKLDLLGQDNFIIGAGKHSAPPYYNHGQLFANLMFSRANPTNRSIGLTNKNTASWSFMENITYMQNTWEDNPTCSTQGNFFLSEGKPGKVLRVVFPEGEFFTLKYSEIFSNERISTSKYNRNTTYLRSLMEDLDSASKFAFQFLIA